MENKEKNIKDIYGKGRKFNTGTVGVPEGEKRYDRPETMLEEVTVDISPQKMPGWVAGALVTVLMTVWPTPAPMKGWDYWQYYWSPNAGDCVPQRSLYSWGVLLGLQAWFTLAGTPRLKVE